MDQNLVRFALAPLLLNPLILQASLSKRQRTLSIEIKQSSPSIVPQVVDNLIQTGAAARTVLQEAGAALLGADPADCTVADSAVTANGNSVSFDR